jgi:hypothetical protein
MDLQYFLQSINTTPISEMGVEGICVDPETLLTYGFILKVNTGQTLNLNFYPFVVH